MKECIGTLTEFAPTVSFREAVKPEQGGTIAVVQAKDVGYDGTLDLSAVARVRELPIRAQAPLLRPGEVLLQSRGTSYRSCIVPGEIGELVAAGGVYVLRPDTKRVDPQYLVLFLNLPATQAVLRKIATGTYILNLRRDALANVEIALPPLADQRALVELGDLLHRSSEIEQRLYQLRRQELHALTLQRSKETRGDGRARPGGGARSTIPTKGHAAQRADDKRLP